VNILFSSAVVLMITVTSAFSGVEYDNLGLGDTYSQNTGFFISSQYSDASAFTAAFTGTLTSIDFGVTAQTPDNHNFNVSIALDASGHPNGTGTFLGIISPTAGFNSTNHAIVSLGGLSFPLASGATYWIELAAAGPNDVGAWNASITTNSPNTQQSADGGATWSTIPFDAIGAFRVNATSVPEAAEWQFLGTGGVLLVIAKRRRRD